MKLLLLLTSLVCINASVARADSFLPENDMWIGSEDTHLLNFGGVNEEAFNRVLTALETLYKPIVSRNGGNLVIQRKWSDGTVNAQASRQGSTWLVEMFGGLARHEAVTEDGLALVACHEIGHHLGGSPRYTAQGGQWASVEGQSDYFSTAKCLRKYFRATGSGQVQADPAARSACQSLWQSSTDVELCARAAMAGQSAANLMWVLGGRRGQSPTFTNPDPSVVTKVYESHPQPQCRMDTYFHGALCNANEDQATSCTALQTRRPSCWFPNSSSNPTPTPNPGPTPAPTPAPQPGDTQAPLLNGQLELFETNPGLPLVISYDVKNISGAGGAYVEISKVNTPFSNPNGTNPDPQRLAYHHFRGVRGKWTLVPKTNLPGWGTYYIRVIPLDPPLARALGKFSNSSAVHLNPPNIFIPK